MKTEEIGKILLEAMYKEWDPESMSPHMNTPSIKGSHPDINSRKIETTLVYLKQRGYIDFEEVQNVNGTCMRFDFRLTDEGVDFVENERSSLKANPFESTIIHSQNTQFIQGNGNIVNQNINNIDPKILEMMDSLISEYSQNKEELESVKTVLVEASKKGKIGQLEKAMVKLCEFTFNHIVGPAAESGIALLIAQLLSST